MDINELIYSFKRDDYQRDNFDSFLKKVSFKYEVPSIHIAGTNGKTVVASMLSNIYTYSGRKTGLFVSSSTRSEISDMIRINGQSVSNSEIEKIINDNQKLFKKYDLSHFEICVFIALSIFKNEEVDIAIIECGMGGEYDATNVFVPVLSIITNVSIEHTECLGVSTSEIALHKAGIIKNNIPTLIGEIEGDALDVIVDVSKRKNSNITRIGDSHNLTPSENGVTFDYKTYRDIYVPNLSMINVKNTCLVIDAVDLLIESFPVSESALKEGLSKSLPNGRFEIIKGELNYIVDAAHNADAIAKLRRDIDNIASGKHIYVIFACFRNKNITVMLPEIALLGKLYLTTFNHDRARDESDYFLYLDEYQFVEDYKEIISKIKEEDSEAIVVITGSTVFAEMVSEQIKNEKL